MATARTRALVTVLLALVTYSCGDSHTGSERHATTTAGGASGQGGGSAITTSAGQTARGGAPATGVVEAGGELAEGGNSARNGGAAGTLPTMGGATSSGGHAGSTTTGGIGGTSSPGGSSSTGGTLPTGGAGGRGTGGAPAMIGGAGGEAGRTAGGGWAGDLGGAGAAGQGAGEGGDGGVGGARPSAGAPPDAAGAGGEAGCVAYGGEIGDYPGCRPGPRYLSAREIAKLLVAPTGTTFVIRIGDSTVAAREAYWFQAMPEIPHVAALTYESFTTHAQPSHTVAAGTLPGPLALPNSPYVDPVGGVTWFPTSGVEAQLTGVNSGATATLSSMFASLVTASRAPLPWARFQGRRVRQRAIVHRHDGAPLTTPGVRTAAIAIGGPSPVYYEGTPSYDLRGSGCVGVEAVIPETHDWAAYATVDMNVCLAANEATTAGDQLAFTCPWLQADGPGVAMLDWAVGGTWVERYSNPASFPSELLAPGGFFDAVVEDADPVVWLEIGANSPDYDQAGQEERLRTVISRFRAWKPGVPFILDIQHAGSSFPSFDSASILAMLAVASSTPGVLLLDGRNLWNFRRGSAMGWYADTIHLTAAGELVKAAEKADQIADIWAAPDANTISFRALPPGEGPATLPGGATVTSGEAQYRTVQISASEIVSGITQNRARIGRKGVDDYPALLLEPERKNWHPYPRGVPPIGGAINVGSGETAYAASGIAGPDGSGDAPRVQVNPSGYSRSYSGSGDGGYVPVVASQWERSYSGSGTSQLGNNTVASGGPTSTVWARRSALFAGGLNLQHVPEDGRDRATAGGIAAGARDALCDFLQVEQGSYLTSAVPVGAGTRTAEALALPGSVTDYMTDGQLLLELVLRPLGARADYGVGVSTPIWFVDAQNYAYFAPSTGVLYVVNGGNSDGVTTIDWTADDVLRLFVASGKVGVPMTAKWQVNMGTVTSATGSTGGYSMTGTAPLQICSGLNGVTFGTYVEQIRWGFVPQWAK
jgi:hypothetical protein